MDEREATLVAESWSGSRGLVPRGPRWLLGSGPASPEEVELHTGVRDGTVWRLQVGGRFLRSGGLVYPGGVPYPEELQRHTAVVSSEVWLYVDEATGRVVGVHSWPEALRRPIASVPRADFDPDAVVPVDEVPDPGFAIRVPAGREWGPILAVEASPDGVVVFACRGTVPDPLNEMLLFDAGGLSLRIRPSAEHRGVDGVLARHQPPFRRARAGRAPAAGREPGKPLGPQTWPWPGELLWWEDGLAWELKGFRPLAALQEIAARLAPV